MMVACGVICKDLNDWCLVMLLASLHHWGTAPHKWEDRCGYHNYYMYGTSISVMGVNDKIRACAPQC